MVKVVRHPIALVLTRLPIAVFVALVAAEASEDPRSRVHFSDLLDGISRNTTMLFVGAVLLLIGWFIYLMNCPRQIRRHSDVETYVCEQITIGFADNKTARAALEPLAGGDSQQNAYWKGEAPLSLSSKCSAADVMEELLEHYAEHKRRKTSDAFWHVLNGSRLGWLYSAWLFLITGSLIAALPTLRTLWRVFGWLTSTPIGT